MRAATIIPMLAFCVAACDESAPSGQRLLYARSSRETEERTSGAGEAPDLSREARIEVAGRVWSIRTAMRSRFVQARRTGYPTGLLAGGLILTGLVVAALVLGRQRSELLHGVNRQLRHEVSAAKLLAGITGILPL